MFVCVRIDLDYVPWDTPDAQEFGHGEPAMLLRLLELARKEGLKYHFFASSRALRAFPSEADAVLNEGHALDWLCKHPNEFQSRVDEARAVFEQFGHTPLGMAVRAAWPAEASLPLGHGLTFLSAFPGPTPEGMRLFPVETRPERDALRSGVSMRAWVDVVKQHLRHVASLRQPATVVLRPQVLAKSDPRLSITRELVQFSRAIGMETHTLRDALLGG